MTFLFMLLSECGFAPPGCWTSSFVLLYLLPAVFVFVCYIEHLVYFQELALSLGERFPTLMKRGAQPTRVTTLSLQ